MCRTRNAVVENGTYMDPSVFQTGWGKTQDIALAGVETQTRCTEIQCVAHVPREWHCARHAIPVHPEIDGVLGTGIRVDIHPGHLDIVVRAVKFQRLSIYSIHPGRFVIQCAMIFVATVVVSRGPSPVIQWPIANRIRGYDIPPYRLILVDRVREHRINGSYWCFVRFCLFDCK